MGERATAATDRGRRIRHFAGRLPWEPDPEPLEPVGFGPRCEVRPGPGEFAAAAPTRPGRPAQGDGPDPAAETRDHRIATVAHDFNNLLAVIMVCAGEIAAGAEGAQLERAEEIRAAARRGVELSRSLLAGRGSGAGRRAGSGRGPLDIAEPLAVAEPLDIAEALARSRKLIERTLGPGIGLAVTVAAALPHVAIGVTDLERVLLNLAANAREAMPAGGLATVAAESIAIAPGDAVLGTGWHVRIGFADDGPGMSAEVARRALEPYFSTKGGAAGSSGLGLAGAHSIVRSAGGDLRIDARPGAGTTASIYLPAVDAAGGSLSLPARAGG